MLNKSSKTNDNRTRLTLTHNYLCIQTIYRRINVRDAQ